MITDEMVEWFYEHDNEWINSIEDVCVIVNGEVNSVDDVILFAWNKYKK